MDINISVKETTTEIMVVGEIDLDSSAALRKALVDALKSSSTKIAVVLAQVEYLDSSGIATLLEGLETAKQSEKDFVLINPSPAVMKILEITRLDSIFSISDN